MGGKESLVSLDRDRRYGCDGTAADSVGKSGWTGFLRIPFTKIPVCPRCSFEQLGAQLHWFEFTPRQLQRAARANRLENLNFSTQKSCNETSDCTCLPTQLVSDASNLKTERERISDESSFLFGANVWIVLCHFCNISLGRTRRSSVCHKYLLL